MADFKWARMPDGNGPVGVVTNFNQFRSYISAMGPEHRKHRRRDISIPVQIKAVDGSYTSGELADVSETGARVKLGRPQSLPEQFMLLLTNHLNRWSRIVWRAGGEVGLEFIEDPHAGATDTDRLSVLFKCPRTHGAIQTGIHVDAADDLGRLPAIKRFTHCPHCDVVHGWTPSEAFLG
jgi:PilZ domain